MVNLLEKNLLNTQEEIILQTLYIIVNISTGNEKHKTLIMLSRNVLQAIYTLMSNSKASIRVATLWCVINLTWTEESGIGFHLK